MFLRALQRACSSSSAGTEKLSFIELAKKAGANALLGTFISRGGFDKCMTGLAIEKIGTGHVTCSLTVDKSHSNTYETLHGGATATIVDIVGTIALLSVNPTKPGVSVDMNISYTSAAKVGTDVRIEGRVLKHGKRLGFTEVNLYDSEGKMVASGRHTKAFPGS
eukprot:m.68414 g.68414  ORF g.68414 m.68414 type:complete len:164 (+) comp19892_c0_seq2:76-567(+)